MTKLNSLVMLEDSKITGECGYALHTTCQNSHENLTCDTFNGKGAVTERGRWLLDCSVNLVKLRAPGNRDSLSSGISRKYQHEMDDGFNECECVYTWWFCLHAKLPESRVKHGLLSGARWLGARWRRQEMRLSGHTIRNVSSGSCTWNIWLWSRI